MKNKDNQELSLIVLMIISGITTSFEVPYTSIALIFISITLSILYLFYFDDFYKDEKNVLYNVLTRFVLSLFPTGFAIYFFNVDLGTKISLVYVILAIAVCIMRRNSITRSTVFWFWIFFCIQTAFLFC